MATEINRGLPVGRTVLSRDDRPIQGIYFPVENEPGWTVGSADVTAIVAYDEHGIGDFVPACRSCNSSKGAKPIDEWWDGRDVHPRLYEALALAEVLP